MIIRAFEILGTTQAQMAVGPATGKGSKKMYPVHVLWLCAKKGGELQLNTPTDMALAAAELLTTYSYMPATGHTALLSQVSVHGLVRCLVKSICFLRSQIRALCVCSLSCRGAENRNTSCCTPTLVSVLSDSVSGRSCWGSPTLSAQLG